MSQRSLRVLSLETSPPIVAPGLDAVEVTIPGAIDTEALQHLFSHSGIRLFNVRCAIPVNRPWEPGVEFRERFAEVMTQARHWGAEWITPLDNTVTSGVLRDMPFEEAFQRYVYGLRELSGLAQDLGIGFLLCNQRGTVHADAASLRRAAKDLGNACRVELVWDATESSDSPPIFALRRKLNDNGCTIVRLSEATGNEEPNS